MFRLRKSQAAMEFLMIYGWAILVVLVAIGALAYFGVLSPDRFLPAKCQLPAGISCTDFKVVASGAEEGVTVFLRNGLGFDMTGVNIAIGTCTSPVAQTIKNGGTATFKAITCGLTSDTRFSESLNVSYTNAVSGISHVVSGQIIGRVE